MSRNNGSAVTLSARLVTQVFKEPKGQDRQTSPTQLKMEKELHPLLGEIWRDRIRIRILSSDELYLSRTQLYAV